MTAPTSHSCWYCDAALPPASFALVSVAGVSTPQECPQCGEHVLRDCRGVPDHAHDDWCEDQGCLGERLEDCLEYAEPGEERCLPCAEFGDRLPDPADGGRRRGWAGCRS